MQSITVLRQPESAVCDASGAVRGARRPARAPTLRLGALAGNRALTLANSSSTSPHAALSASCAAESASWSDWAGHKQSGSSSPSTASGAPSSAENAQSCPYGDERPQGPMRLITRFRTALACRTTTPKEGRSTERLWCLPRNRCDAAGRDGRWSYIPPSAARPPIPSGCFLHEESPCLGFLYYTQHLSDPHLIPSSDSMNSLRRERAAP
jgi:hypothetical protein